MTKQILIDKDTLNLVIGLKIRKLRKSQGITQELLASNINVLRSTIANIETGRQGTTLDTLYKIAVYLEVEVTDILPTIKLAKTANIFTLDDVLNVSNLSSHFFADLLEGSNEN